MIVQWCGNSFDWLLLLLLRPIRNRKLPFRIYGIHYLSYNYPVPFVTGVVIHCASSNLRGHVVSAAGIMMRKTEPWRGISVVKVPLLEFARHFFSHTSRVFTLAVPVAAPSLRSLSLIVIEAPTPWAEGRGGSG